VEVILVPASRLERDGSQKYFVEIKGVPHARGHLVVTGPLQEDQAEKVRQDIEDGLDAYRRPTRTRRRGKTFWQRLKDE